MELPADAKIAAPPREAGLFWLRPSQLSGAKETAGHPFFHSVVVRWSWRFIAQRLTQAGRWFLLPSLFFFAYSLSSLELQAYVPFLYAASIWFVGLAITLIFTPKVNLTVRMADRVCAGEVLQVEAEVEQLGRLGGIDLKVLPHRLPPEIDPVPFAGASLPQLAQGERAAARLGLRATRRGAYELRGFKVESDFPFGLLRAYRFQPDARRLLVYPRFEPLTRFDLPSGRRYQPGGVALASVLGDSTEFIGDREYREGDNVRDVDWRATARLDKLIVREYREEYFVRVALVLDTHVPRRAKKARVEDFERAVSLCAAVGDYLARQEYLIDIFAAGPSLYHLTAGRGLARLDQILDILACVEDHDEEAFETVEPQIVAHLSRISALVAVFTDWTESRRRFAYGLRAHGVALKPIVVRDAPCTLDPAAEPGALGPIPVLTAERFARGLQEV